MFRGGGQRQCAFGGVDGQRGWCLVSALLVLSLFLTCGSFQAHAATANVQTASVASVAPVPDGPRILAARLGEHGDKTRFVLELSQPARFTIQHATSPHSVVIDIQAGWGAMAPAPRGLVRAVMTDADMPSAVRILLPTAGPTRVLLAEIIPARDGMPPRFILDLAPATGQPSGVATSPVTRPTQVAALSSAPPRPPAKPLLPLVVLDPGHGGQDPGAIAVSGGYEKDITLAMAREMRRQLLATGRYRVILTRDKDMFIPLRDRASIARSKGADLFISLHADSIGSKQIRGLSIYTLSEKASDREAEMLAARENQSDAIGGLRLAGQSADVASILINLSQRDTMNNSRRFAHLLLNSLDKNIAVLPGPLRSAGFAVLTAPDVPSVLVELGYLSHAQDAKLLTSDAHRRRVAGSLLRAVDGYFVGKAGASRS